MDTKKSDADKQSLYEKMVKKKIHLYVFVVVSLFVLSFFLGLVVYNIVARQSFFSPVNKKETGLAPSRELLSLSVGLAEKAPESESNSDKTRRLLDGVYVESGQENNFPVAVMIDNNIYARPHSGLARADLVYEAEVEGSATRYMAVFADLNDLEEIGPVRSARPYFVNWALELSALYVHVGGSPEALVNIKRDKVYDFNEFYNGDYFWRDWDRSAPHNVYSSGENLKKYTDARSFTKGDFSAWQFKDEAEEGDRGENSREISIGFLIKGYAVKWVYDRASNSYIRYLGGVAHIDKSGEGVTAKNIIIQYAEAEVIDRELRLDMEETGSGQAILCRDGFCRKGSWQKKDAPERTRFYDEGGDETVLNAGVTWVEVVRPGIVEVVVPE